LPRSILDAGNHAVASLIARQQAPAAPPVGVVQTPGGLAVRAAIQQATTPDQLAAIIAELRRAAAAAPTDRSVGIPVLIAGPTQIASYEAPLLLAEAEHAAGLVAPPNLPSGVDPGRGNVAGVKAQLARAKALLDDPASGLTDEQRAELRTAVAQTEASVAGYEQLSSQGGTRTAAMAPLALAGGGIVADDATGVGVADDPLLILVGIAALAVLVATKPAAPEPDLEDAWRKIANDLQKLGEIGTGIMMAVQGPRAAGQLTNIARHLARLLALSSVGGVPSGEPPKKDDKDDKHWWSEIKGSIQQFRQAIKGASRKQVLRELIKLGFTEAQIAEIEAALTRAAEQMGEVIGNLLPPP
jgi:hypothetical protein